jgi:hypothetical protein
VHGGWRVRCTCSTVVVPRPHAVAWAVRCRSQWRRLHAHPCCVTGRVAQRRLLGVRCLSRRVCRRGDSHEARGWTGRLLLGCGCKANAATLCTPWCVLRGADRPCGLQVLIEFDAEETDRFIALADLIEVAATPPPQPHSRALQSSESDTCHVHLTSHGGGLRRTSIRILWWMATQTTETTRGNQASPC